MQHETIICRDGQTNLHYQLLTNSQWQDPRPCVLIFHAFEGVNPLMLAHAERIVNMGYAALVVDMYGEGTVGADLEQCMGLIMPMLDDRQIVARRVNLALAAAKQQTRVDSDRTAAIGFCFGGLCVLDLARSGAAINGVVSVHGVLAPPPTAASSITAKVLALHGYDDPQIPAQQLTDFQQEMTQANVDWQLLYFGHTKHAFSDPEADKIGAPEMGRVYNPIAAERSWQYAASFFAEVFDV